MDGWVVITVEEWMILAMYVLGRVSELGGLTVDGGVLIQAMGGFANLPTFVAGEEQRFHRRDPKEGLRLRLQELRNAAMVGASRAKSQECVVG
jgi:hypothetical protein